MGIARDLPNAPRISALEVQPPVHDGTLTRKLEGGYFDRAGLFGRSDQPADRPPPDLALSGPEQLEGLPIYWILGQEKTACLRPGDQLLREFEASGKWLGECGALSG